MLRKTRARTTAGHDRDACRSCGATTRCIHRAIYLLPQIAISSANKKHPVLPALGKFDGLRRRPSEPLHPTLPRRLVGPRERRIVPFGYRPPIGASVFSQLTYERLAFGKVAFEIPCQSKSMTCRERTMPAYHLPRIFRGDTQHLGYPVRSPRIPPQRPWADRVHRAIEQRS
jgi:hypothetical protein